MSEAYDAAVEVRGSLDSVVQELDYIGKQLDNSNLGDRRERIATAVLAGLLHHQPVSRVTETSGMRPEQIAVKAVNIADALIAELAKPQPEKSAKEI